MGYGSLSDNELGSFNTSAGSSSLAYNVNGNRNIAIGYSTTNLGDYSDTIVIGNIVDTLGDYTTVIGNIGTLTTAIYGNLILGNTYDDGMNKLQVTGGGLFTEYLTSYSGFINTNGDVNSFLKADGSLDNNGYLIKSGDIITGNIGNTSTGYFIFPNGTTAQRPSSPVSGMHRYNTNTLRDEFYANGSWQNHARLSGDTFTGSIFATNLSGTNTGDETSSTIISKLGYTPANDSSVVHIANTETITGVKSFQGTTSTDAGQLGVELLTTGTGDASWVGTSYATGYTHSTGSVTTLTSALSAVIGNFYQYTITVTGRTTGSFTISFGTMSSGQITANQISSITSSSIAPLIITPTTDFNGTIVFGIKQVTSGTATTSFLNSTGTSSSAIEIRASSASSNTFIGKSSGIKNVSGLLNTFLGNNAGANIISGNRNTFLGSSLGTGLVSSNFNVLVGNSIFTSTLAVGNYNSYSIAIGGNIGGTTATSAASGNIFIGYSLATYLTSGSGNLAMGYETLNNITSGNYNVALGGAAGSGNATLGFNTTGSRNVAVGVSAGAFISDGITPATMVNNSVIIGSSAKFLADNQTNQIVIGYNSIGLGSNSSVIGNSSTLTTAIYGNLLLGGTTTHNAKLDVTGPSIQNGDLFFSQPGHTSLSNTGTLDIIFLLTHIITVTSAVAVSLTLPTGTLTDAGVLGGLLPVQNAFEWNIINLGSSIGIVTIVAGVGHTIIGLATIPILSQATFRTTKIATNTFITYRIA